MITYEDLKKLMVKNGWTAEAIDLMNESASSIGPQSLNYLYNNLDDFGFNGGKVIAELVSKFKIWRSEIETGSSTTLVGSLVSSLSSSQMQQVGLLSSFIYDLHSNQIFAARIDDQLDRRLFIFQFANLEELPSREIELGLVNHAVDLALVLDLESELKRFAYYKNYSFDAKELRKFRNALSNCDQLLTDKQLGLNNTTVNGSVKNFIQDFSEFTAGLPAHNSSYAVANYITNSPSVKLLDRYSLGALRRILEIYVWLLEGNYTSEEIQAYESEREVVLESFPRLISGEHGDVTTVSTQELVSIDAVSPTPPPSTKAPVLSEPEHFAHPEPVIPVRPSPLSDNAVIHDLINQKRKEKIGVVKDVTNIKIEEETQRIEQDLIQQDEQIQKKLEELKIRNKKS